MSQPTANSFGDNVLNRELADLRRLIDQLYTRISTLTVSESSAPTVPPSTALGTIEVRQTDGAYDNVVSVIEVDQVDIVAADSGEAAKLNLAATAVAAGSYLSTNLTVDAKGRLTAAASGRVAIPLFDHYADVGNGTTVETDLYTDTLTAAILGANGDKVIGRYAGLFAGDATSTQQLKMYFGGTAIYDSGALTIGVATNFWNIDVVVIRESSSVVRCEVTATSDFATLFPYAKYTRITGLTLENTQILKITGTAAGVTGGSNQIVAKQSYNYWMKAA